VAEAKNNPSYECAAYSRQMPDWQIVNDCYRGTRAIRARGKDYLPQEPAESPRAYEIRLCRAIFWNAFRRTIQGLVGMKFRQNPKIEKDVPPEIVKHLENIDLQGNHFDVFSKRVDVAATIDGHTFILVEMPPKLTGNPTLADERASGRRPYWVHYCKNQIPNWRTENRNGKTVLTRVTIRETVCEPDGEYGEKEVTQYRVLTPGAWAVYRKSESDAGVYVEVDSGDTSLDEIPLVAIYTNRTGFFESDPPMLGVALENLREYRLQSDLDHILHVANVPILVRVGASDPNKPLEVGPNSVADVPLDGDLKYVEHKGEAIGKAQEEIVKAKENIAALGLATLADKPQVQQTATESVLDYESETSELSSMARGLEDGLEQALMYHAMYLGLPDGGGVEVNKDFGRVKLTPQDIQAYSVMVGSGQLSVETLWAILARADSLPDGFDADEEKKRIADPLKAIQIERAKLGLEADKQAMTGNPIDIQRRIMEGASGVTN